MVSINNIIYCQYEGQNLVIILTRSGFMFFWQESEFSRHITWVASSYPYCSEILCLSNMTEIVFYLFFFSWDIHMLILWIKLMEHCKLKYFQQRIFCAGQKSDRFSQYWGEIRILVKANSLGHLKILGLGMLSNRPVLFQEYQGSR